MTMAMRITMMLLMAWAIVPGAAFGQSVNIGFVNVAQLLSESPQAKAAMEALQEEFAPKQRDIIAQQNRFKEEQERVQRDLEVMGAEERRNAERDLRKAERDIARSQEEITEDFNLRRNEELGKLQRTLILQIQSYAREAGYDLVLSDGVLFASQAVDITPQILSGLESSFEQSAAPE